MKQIEGLPAISTSLRVTAPAASIVCGCTGTVRHTRAVTVRAEAFVNMKEGMKLMDDDGIMLAMNEDSVFEEYDDSLDITIHFSSQEDRIAFIFNMSHMRRWITDRDPTPEEVEQAGDAGFILCISGKIGRATYDHAVNMGDNCFENGKWYLYGAQPMGREVFKVHGWMLPPEAC